MFADPTTVTYSATDYPLACISRNSSSSVYTYEDGADNYKVTVSNLARKDRTRYVLRVDRYKTTSDPFLPSTNMTVSQSVYMVIDRPNAGFTHNETLNLSEFFIAMLGEFEIGRILKGES